MIYIHVIDTSTIDGKIKTLTVKNQSAEKLARIISLAEEDNLIIVQQIRNEGNVITRSVKKVFLNGREGVNHQDILIKQRKK